MLEKDGLRHRIIGEFTFGMSTVDDLTSNLPEVNDGQQEMQLSPELAADFEYGLESEIGAACGCGHSCSGNGLENSVDSCSICHHHG